MHLLISMYVEDGILFEENTLKVKGDEAVGCSVVALCPGLGHCLTHSWTFQLCPNPLTFA